MSQRLNEQKSPVAGEMTQTYGDSYSQFSLPSKGLLTQHVQEPQYKTFQYEHENNM